MSGEPQVESPIQLSPHELQGLQLGRINSGSLGVPPTEATTIASGSSAVTTAVESGAAGGLGGLQYAGDNDGVHATMRKETGNSTLSSRIRRKTQEMMTPARPIGAEPTVAASLRALILGSSEFGWSESPSLSGIRCVV